ncbi:MAG: alpha/beta fold hydrolase [Candidatus Bipolaricaulis sp.]|nr:alpha/beta fold hydrolase [Candidatus Bipolaricaulis sp.]
MTKARVARRAAGALAALLILLAGTAGATVPRLPVILVYGFQPAPGFLPTRLWEAFAERLSGRSIAEAAKQAVGENHLIYALGAADDEHFDVYMSHYAGALEPTVRDLRYYAARLAEEVTWIRTATGAEAVDLVGHSMGGLVARCYVECGDFGPLLGQPGFKEYGTTYGHDVRTLITLATPHHGAGFAALGTWLGPLVAELAPNSRLLQTLNAPGPDGLAIDPAVRYVAMAGQSCFGCGLLRDTQACQERCVRDAVAWSGSDLVVSMESAHLAGAETTACLGMDHVDMHVNALLADVVAAVLAGAPAPAFLSADSQLDPALVPAPNGDQRPSP